MAQQSAVELVLSSPDLLEHILKQLPRPQLVFSSLLKAGRGRCVNRAAACEVNKSFRQAALRLPWGAELDHGCAASPATLAAVCRLRHLQCLEVALWQETLPSSAVLLGLASGLEELRVSFEKEGHLLEWLQHTTVPLHAPAAGPVQGSPTILSRLSSLSQLTSITLRSRERSVWRNAAWLTTLSQLSYAQLENYAGPPVAGNSLKSLRVLFYNGRQFTRQFPRAKAVLGQWALPGLTALELRNCKVLIGYAPSGARAQGSSVDSAVGRTSVWQHGGLQRLHLTDVCMFAQGTGFRELFPCLTFLAISSRTPKQSGCFEAVLSEGVPLSLQELSLRCYESPLSATTWSTAAVLDKLVSLDVTQGGGVLAGEGLEGVGAAVDCLSQLPRLKHASLTWLVTAKRGPPTRAVLDESFRDLGALLSTHGASLAVNVRCW